METDGGSDSSERKLTEIDEREPLDMGSFCHVVGDEDLTSTSDVEDARAPIHRRAGDIAVAAFDLTQVDGDPDRELILTDEPTVLRESHLDLGRRRQCRLRIIEHRQEAIAAILDDGATGASHRRGDELVVTRQHLGHQICVAFPQPGGIVDVGEQDRAEAVHRPLNRRALL